MSDKKDTVRLFMVPIYIRVSEGFDHYTTLCGCLGQMEDHSGSMFTDTERMIDCGEQHGEDIPTEGVGDD